MSLPHALLVSLVLVGTTGAAPRPLGQVVWTTMTDGRASLSGHTFLPPEAPRDLWPDGPRGVDPAGYLDPRAPRLEETTKVAADSPRATLGLLHPALDHTGSRVLFISGETWGPDTVPEERPAASPGGAIGGGGLSLRFRKSEGVASDPRAAGAVMDSHPVSDPEGRHVYFSRFFYRDGPGGGAGWFLMRARYRDLERGEAEVVEDGEGTPIRGNQPFVTADGRFLVYVKPDRGNAGSDVFVMSLDPPGPETLLADGEGPYPRPERGADPTTGASSGMGAAPVEAWNAYSMMGGKARISHPVVSPDGSWLAYSCDRDGDWDLYLRKLVSPGPGRLETEGDEIPVQPEAVVEADPASGMPGPGGDDADDMNPSFSGDGLFLAYASDRADASPTSARGDGTRIWVVGVEAAGGPAYHEAIPSTAGSNDGGALWPYWDQDTDPPHLSLTLSPEGGGEPMVLELTDVEPDPGPGKDAFDLSLRMRDHHPLVPPPGVGRSVAFPPIRVGRGTESRPLRLVYPTDGPNGESLLLLLSRQRERVGEHRGLAGLERTASGRVPRPGGRKGARPGIAGGGRGEEPTGPLVDGDTFDGLFTFEDVRIRVDALARDDRWLRTGVPADLAGTLFPEGVPPPRVESRTMRREDPRSLPVDSPKRPYLAKVSRRESLEEGRPGITWWVEEREGEGDFVVRDENAPHLLFRAPNYPPADHPEAPELYLRVVVRDLLQNVTDLRIPIHVRPRGFEVDTLQLGTQRRSI